MERRVVFDHVLGSVLAPVISLVLAFQFGSEFFYVNFIVFLIILILVEITKRWLIFRLSENYDVCGLYFELYFRSIGGEESLVLAPFIIGFDPFVDNLRINGMAFRVKDGKFIDIPNSSRWNSASVYLPPRQVGNSFDLYYIYIGDMGPEHGLPGITRLGVPKKRFSDSVPRVGFFCDLRERGRGSDDIGAIRELSERVGLFRFASVKMPRAYFYSLGASEKIKNLMLRLRLYYEPSEGEMLDVLDQKCAIFIASRLNGDAESYARAKEILRSATFPGKVGGGVNSRDVQHF